jgi:hypothetical protein
MGDHTILVKAMDVARQTATASVWIDRTY